MKFKNYFYGFKLIWGEAIKTSIKGRASGGHLFGIRTSLLQAYDFEELGGTTTVRCLQQNDLYIVPYYINCNKWNNDYEILYDTLQKLSGRSVLLIGDFNARIGDFQITTVYDVSNSAISNTKRQSKDNTCNKNGRDLLQLLQLYDLLILNGCTDGDMNGHYTFTGGQGRSVIDFCTVNNEWINQIHRFEVQFKPFSDHMPIVVEITRTSSTRGSNLNLLPRLFWKNELAPFYKRSLDTLLTSSNVSQDSPEVIINKLTEYIRDSTINKSVSPNIKFKQKWFDQECYRARTKSFALLKALRSSNNPKLRSWYLEANTSYKSLCIQKKFAYENEKALELGLTKNPKDFWKIAKEINGSNYKIGASISAESLAVHFSRLLSNNSNITFITMEPIITDQLLDADIKIEEIQDVLSKAKNKKAPGEDGIPYEFFKNATPMFFRHLKILYNKIFTNADIPSCFKKSIIFPIHKKGSLDSPENYRGISFMNVIAKIFCSVLVQRLEKWVEQNNVLSDLQAGFRKNFSTIDQIFTLSSIVKAFQSRNKKVFTFFVDFKAAFDLVNRNALIYKLAQLGISSKFIKIIREMYTDTKAAVWDGVNFSKWFHTNTGVRQGCPLSALLFSLFINDVAEELPGGIRIAGSTVNVLLYADDLVILSETPEGLQLMINRLYNYCIRWGLSINTAKSKIMVFSRTHCVNSRRRWKYNDTQLEIANDIKYLGVKLNPTLNFNSHLCEKAKSSQSLINITWKNIFSNKQILLSAKYKIFNSVVKSTLFYAAQIWGSEEYEDIEKFYRNFIKKLFNLPLNTPNYAIYLETGLPKLFISTLKLQADYIIKICNIQGNTRLTKKLLLYELRNKDWWFARWRSIGSECGISLNDDLNNINNLKEQLYNIIEKTDETFRYSLIQEAKKSFSRIIYSQLKYNLGTRNYFQDSLSSTEISLIFKARCEVLNLNGTPYNGSFNQFCTLCNLKSKEDCFHLIAICPIFKAQRRYYFKKNILTLQETINILNEHDWKSLSKFLNDIYNYRLLLITEYK